MPFYLLVIILVFGFLINFLILTQQVKSIRKGGRTINAIEIGLCSLYFGFLPVFFFFIYDEIREFNRKNHNILLISGIVSFVVDALVIFLLIYFNLVTF